MPKIYAIVDIHGNLDTLHDALKVVDLSDETNQLVILGDCIDWGNNSLKGFHTNPQIEYFIGGFAVTAWF
ncbi:MAG: hypothetical protein LBB94_09595 [Clostridiales bacterium]|jgi:predicted phosphodiesterase|nr:hypothetical protein [Clostridiales bacterium]